MTRLFDDSVLKTLRYVYNQTERCRNAELESLGVTSAQAGVLLFLFKNKKYDLTQQTVQMALALSHPTVTGLMQRLEAKGFIKRVVNPADFRSKFVRLTEKGLEIEKAVKAGSKRLSQRALNGLSDEEIAHLTKALSIVAENFRRQEENASVQRIIKKLPNL